MTYLAAVGCGSSQFMESRLMPEGLLPAQIAAYRDMQRSIPGVDGLYAATRAILAASIQDAGRLLVVGAGGGRELELFSDIGPELCFLAVDVSGDRLEQTKAFVTARGLGERIEYVAGSVEAAPEAPLCVGATSLLVMHSIPDDGTKLRYLQAIRSRLVLGAPFVLADVSFSDQAEFERIVPAFLEHARHAGVATHSSDVDPRVIPTMPVINDRRTRELLAQAGFGDVTPFFRGFWYAGWWARAS